MWKWRAEKFLKSINLAGKKLTKDFILLNKNKTYFQLYELIKDISYIILLSDERLDRETSDINNMHWYINPIKFREVFDLKFFVLAIDENRILFEQKYSNDFIVSTNIVSMFLAQTEMNPKLKSFFD